MITININPVAFTIGAVEIRWYGIMMVLAILVLLLWAVREVRKGADLTYDNVFTIALVAIPSGIIFARLLHVVDRWDYYSRFPGQIIGSEGLAIYGAVLGAVIALWVYGHFSNFRFGYTMDLVVPGIILAQAIGRVGCILNGCCYGDVCALPWAMLYTHPDSVANIGVAVHPTQAYEILFLLLVFPLILWLRGRLKPDGSRFMVYLSLYSLWRFAVGFMREGTSFLLGLQQAQVIAIVVLAVIVPLLIYRTQWVKARESTK